MNFATLNTDPFRFADPITGPGLLKAALARCMGEYRMDVDQGLEADTFSLDYSDDATERFSEHITALKAEIGPLLENAIELRIRWARDGGEEGPELHYAGPTEEMLQACKMRHAIDEAIHRLAHVVPAEQLRNMFAHLEPAAPGQSSDEDRRRRAMKHAEAVLQAVGDPEIARIASRAATEISAQGLSSPALWRETYVVTVLTDEPPREFSDLGAIHREITTGSCTGTFGQLIVEPLDREAAIRAVEEVGSDPGFFPHLVVDEPAADPDQIPKG